MINVGEILKAPKLNELPNNYDALRTLLWDIAYQYFGGCCASG